MVCACDLSSIRSHHADTLDTFHSAPSSSVATFFFPLLSTYPLFPFLFVVCQNHLHYFISSLLVPRVGAIYSSILSGQRISPFFCLFSLSFSCQTLHSFSSPLPLPLRHTTTGLPVLSSRSDPFASTLSCLDQKERLTVNVRGCISANNNI